MKFNIQRKAAQRTLADTKSFQALVELFLEVLGGTTSTDKYTAPSTTELSEFRNWVSNLMINTSEHAGVMWLHCTLGRVAIPVSAKQVSSINQNNRLADFLVTLSILGANDKDESVTRKYQYMLAQAWLSSVNDDESFAKKDVYLYRLHNILTQHALAETITLYGALGWPKSKTLKLIEEKTVQELDSLQGFENQYTAIIVRH